MESSVIQALQLGCTCKNFGLFELNRSFRWPWHDILEASWRQVSPGAAFLVAWQHQVGPGIAFWVACWRQVSPGTAFQVARQRQVGPGTAFWVPGWRQVGPGTAFWAPQWGQVGPGTALWSPRWGQVGPGTAFWSPRWGQVASKKRPRSVILVGGAVRNALGTMLCRFFVYAESSRYMKNLQKPRKSHGFYALEAFAGNERASPQQR